MIARPIRCLKFISSENMQDKITHNFTNESAPGQNRFLFYEVSLPFSEAAG